MVEGVDVHKVADFVQPGAHCSGGVLQQVLMAGTARLRMKPYQICRDQLRRLWQVGFFAQQITAAQINFIFERNGDSTPRPCLIEIDIEGGNGFHAGLNS